MMVPTECHPLRVPTTQFQLERRPIVEQLTEPMTTLRIIPTLALDLATMMTMTGMN